MSAAGDMPDLDEKTAKGYAHLKRRWTLAALLLDAVYLAALPLTGWAQRWEQVLIAQPWAWPIQTAVFVTGLALPWTLVTMPLDWVRGFRIEHRFGLSRETLGAWGRRWLKTQTIGGLLLLAVTLAFVWILRASPDFWWAWMALLGFVWSVLLTQWMPVVLLPLFYRQRPIEKTDLIERLKQLAQHCGAPVRGVYEIDLSKETSKANACLCGLGSTRRVLLTDTLLRHYTPEEIEAVFAHELGHHHLRHLSQMMVVGGFSMGIGFWVMAQILPGALEAFQIDGLQSLAALPLVALALSIFGLILTPAQNGLSRSLERAADRFALETTRAPGPFIAAMLKLQKQNLAESQPSRWVEWFWYDHPPIAKRVAMAQQFHGKMSVL